MRTTIFDMGFDPTLAAEYSAARVPIIKTLKKIYKLDPKTTSAGIKWKNSMLAFYQKQLIALCLRQYNAQFIVPISTQYEIITSLLPKYYKPVDAWLSPEDKI